MTDDIDTSMQAVWRAWQAFRQGKRPSEELMRFQFQLEPHLFSLHHDLQQGTYYHGNYNYFVVHDPKRREIAVASIRDRVMHRLLYDYLLGVWDKSFIYDAWNCRPGKGLLGAVERASFFSKRYRHGWIWRSDIRKFFDSVDHETLKFLLGTKLCRTPRVTTLLDTVIDSYDAGSTGRGLPIGNLTSQIFANIYLNEFDQFVLHTLRPLGYVRYGDDFVLWCPDEAAAREAQVVGTQFLGDYLALSVNEKHDCVQPASKRLRYLGVEIWPTGRRLQTSVQRRITRKLTLENLSSYESLTALHMPPRYRRRLRWQKLDIIDEVW